MKVLITSGRDYADRDQLYDELEKLHGDSEIRTVVIFNTDGAGGLARRWADERCVTRLIFGDWQEGMADIVLAFHGAPAELLKRCKASRVYIETIPLRISCDHINPAKWVHRSGAAYCPHCGKWMGNVGA